MSGQIHLILGAMFAGKTTELLRRKRRAELAGKKCLLIKYYGDNRYDETKIVTHDHITENAIISAGNSLKKTIDIIANLENYHCIFIDEIQFYQDGAQICDYLANSGFDVTVCGLQGDYQRNIFQCISDLIPKVEEIVHLTAIDKMTGNDATFTARITSELEQEVIGGGDKYMATDRKHYMSLQN